MRCRLRGRVVRISANASADLAAGLIDFAEPAGSLVEPSSRREIVIDVSMSANAYGRCHMDIMPGQSSGALRVSATNSGTSIVAGEFSEKSSAELRVDIARQTTFSVVSNGRWAL